MRIDLEGRVFESNITVTPRALSVRRELLDRWLMEEMARLPNVDIWLKTRIISTVRFKNRLIGVNYKRPNGEEASVYAKVVIGADGRHSVVASSVGAQATLQSEDHHLAVYYAYIRHLDPLPIPTVEWYWSHGEIVLCNPLDMELHCVAVMLTEHMFRQWGTDPVTHYMERLRQIQTLAPRMKKAQVFGKLRGVSKSISCIRQPYGDQWVLVGDAGANLHPVSGTGIDNAVCTAEILAGELCLYMQGAKTWEEAMSSYTKQRDERIVPQYHNCLRTLARAAQDVDAESLQTLDVLCTFPGLVKQMGHRSQSIYSRLMEGLTND
jgi:flavin-dependent dehydrogenase